MFKKRFCFILLQKNSHGNVYLFIGFVSLGVNVSLPQVHCIFYGDIYA